MLSFNFLFSDHLIERHCKTYCCTIWILQTQKKWKISHCILIIVCICDTLDKNTSPPIVHCCILSLCWPWPDYQYRTKWVSDSPFSTASASTGLSELFSFLTGSGTIKYFTLLIVTRLSIQNNIKMVLLLFFNRLRYNQETNQVLQAKC